MNDFNSKSCHLCGAPDFDFLEPGLIDHPLNPGSRGGVRSSWDAGAPLFGEIFDCRHSKILVDLSPVAEIG